MTEFQEINRPARLAFLATNNKETRFENGMWRSIHKVVFWCLNISCDTYASVLTNHIPQHTYKDKM